MNSTNFVGIIAAVCASIGASPLTLRVDPPQYTVLDLGTFGGRQGIGTGINDLGQVAGWYYIADGIHSHTAVWTGGTPIDLAPPPSNTMSEGFGINASGQVSGFAYQGSGTYAVRWTGTTPTVLGTLGGGSYGFGINDSGQVAGFSGNYAVRWTGTTPVALGSLGGTSSRAYGINDSGQIAGYSRTSSNISLRAVRWTGTTAEDLGTLPGDDWSLGYGINAAGQVVGYSVTGSDKGVQHAVLWTGTTPTYLGTLGGASSAGYAINDSGDMIGMSDTANGYAAFLYTGGTMYDLNSLLVPGSGVSGLQLSEYGNAINNSDQIAAYGYVDGTYHALLLTPTPEPASTSLLLGGVALLALHRRRG